MRKKFKEHGLNIAVAVLGDFPCKLVLRDALLQVLQGNGLPDTDLAV